MEPPSKNKAVLLLIALAGTTVLFSICALVVVYDGLNQISLAVVHKTDIEVLERSVAHAKSITLIAAGLGVLLGASLAFLIIQARTACSKK